MTPGFGPPPETRAACVALDAEDPLGGLRELFRVPADLIYLDGNSLGVLPRATPGRVARALESEWGEGLIRSWNEAHWITLPETVGAKIATLIGAHAAEVVATDSTSVNLFKVLAAALRMQATDAPARRTIVSERGNFPTDLYMAQGLIDLIGATGGPRYELRLVDSPLELTAALDAQCALVLLTHVNFKSGAVHDMAALSAHAHRQGALVIWDLAHSAGAVPVALNRDGADFAVGCGYKFLNGGPGAPAFVYVATRHQDRFSQPLSGWLGHAAPFDFDPVYRPRAGIGRYLCGTPPILSMAALDAGVDSVLAATELGGVAALHAKSVALGDLFIARVAARCAGAGLALITPRALAERGSQVSFRAPPELGGGYAVMQALIDRGVIGDFRAPDVLRFGLTPLYTRFVDIWDAVEHLAAILESRAWDRPEFHQRAAVT